MFIKVGKHVAADQLLRLTKTTIQTCSDLLGSVFFFDGSVIICDNSQGQNTKSE